MAISSDTLKSEREALKARLREIEVEQRKVEAELKKVRQTELRTKREIDALSTLIDLADDALKDEAGKEPSNED